jgi:hypothetical protein
MEQEQNLDQNIVTASPNVEEALSDKVQKTEPQTEIKYDGDSVREAITDFMTDLEGEDYENLMHLANEFSADKDYTPEEIDSMFSASNLNPELLEKIENQILKYNRTNLTRKQEFINDTDSDISRLNGFIADINEFSESEDCSTIAGYNCCSRIIKTIEKLVKELNQLKNYYNGDRAVWANDENKIEQAWKKRIPVVLLPEENQNNSEEEA